MKSEIYLQWQQQAIWQCLPHAWHIADFNITSVQLHKMNQRKAGKQHRANCWGLRRPL